MSASEKYFVHEKAICESSNIGEKTRIWAFAHVLPGAVIGSNCNICEHVYVEHDVIVGNNVTIKNGVQLWNGIRIEDDVFIGPNVIFENNKGSGSGLEKKETPVVIQKNAELRAGAIFSQGLTIGPNAVIGAGAVVTKNVPPHAVVEGNPAQIVKYTSTPEKEGVLRGSKTLLTSSDKISMEPEALGVGDSKLWPLFNFKDLRGNLTVAELHRDLPFAPKRCFFVYDVSSYETRGEHAHKICHQFLIAVHGEMSVALDDGINRKEVRLCSPDVGLYLPAGIWGIQYKFTSNAVLCVFASHEYQSEDYIREYKEFVQYVKSIN